MNHIILDLDSTIISSLLPSVKQPKGLIGHDMDGEFMVYERPHLQKFLNFLFKNYQVGVWTAASKDYCIFIVEHIILKPGRELKFVLFDYHGDISEKISTNPKNLKLVWEGFDGWTKENTIIIDDYDEVYTSQPKNCYHIPAFEANDPNATEDTELLELTKILKRGSLDRRDNK